jgi:hypothetical protein
MLTALILVCSLETSPDVQSCTRETAVDTMRVPEAFANPAMCFMHGQAYLADTSLGRELTEKEWVKIVCVRTASLPATMGSAQNTQFR